MASSDRDDEKRRKPRDEAIGLGYIPVPPGMDDPLDADEEDEVVERLTDLDEAAGEAPLPRSLTVPGEPDSTEDTDMGGPDEDDEVTIRSAAPPVRAVEEPAPEDPRDVARRVAREAKRNAPTPPAEDPRDVARRVADEAKRKARPQAKAAPEPVVTPEPAVTPEPKKKGGRKKKGSLAERATRPVSAKQALEAAVQKESERAVEKEAAVPAIAKPAAEEGQGAPAQKASAAAKPAAKAPAGARSLEPAIDPEVIVAGFVPGAVVRARAEVRNTNVFRAIWQAHRARALRAGDVPLAATASALLDAVDRIGRGHLLGLDVAVDEVGYALWIDVERGTVIAACGDPATFLKGIG